MTETEYQARLAEIASWIKDGLITRDEAILRSRRLTVERYAAR